MAGFRLAVAHVLERQRGRFGSVLFAVVLLWVVVGAFVERGARADLAATGTLLGPVFGLAIPLSIFAIVRRTSGYHTLMEVIDSCALQGVSRRSVALGLVTGVTCCAVVSAIALSSVALLVVHGVGDHALASDLVTTSWIAALGALAYSCLFLSGAQFGRRGVGALVLLIGDWGLGSSTTFAAVPWPRAHLFNLLGGPVPLGMPAWQASAALIGLSLVYGAFFSLRLAR